MSEDVVLVEGAVAVDDRGKVQFCNDFDMSGIRRFYVVTNHENRFIRAWHAHKEETKFAYVASGAALLATVRIDDWNMPDKSATVLRFVLSEDKPGVLKIPGGHAHGAMNLRADTRIFFFSTSTVAESMNDDYRYDFDYWDSWAVTPR